MKLGRGLSAPSVLAQHYDAATLARQALWLECCQSCETHRFDCSAVEVVKRGAGPVLRKVTR